jgi:Holliday junction DNA helicase RuvA
MIVHIEGKMVLKEPTHVVIDVNGMGYEVLISLHTFSKLGSGEKVRLKTHFHVREDAQLLYGFYDEDEKSLFLQLISVSGIGPNTALVLLSSLAPAEARQAIVSNDVDKIQSVKGIGAKTAKRVILELKDKLDKTADGPISHQITDPKYNTLRNEALSALTTLGINKSTAEKNIDAVLKSKTDSITLEELIKLSLKN